MMKRYLENLIKRDKTATAKFDSSESKSEICHALPSEKRKICQTLSSPAPKKRPWPGYSSMTGVAGLSGGARSGLSGKLMFTVSGLPGSGGGIPASGGGGGLPASGVPSTEDGKRVDSVGVEDGLRPCAIRDSSVALLLSSVGGSVPPERAEGKVPASDSKSGGGSIFIMSMPCRLSPVVRERRSSVLVLFIVEPRCFMSLRCPFAKSKSFASKSSWSSSSAPRRRASARIFFASRTMPRCVARMHLYRRTRATSFG